MGNPSRLFICRKINSRLRVMMRGAQRIVALFLCPDANSLLAAINEITKGGQTMKNKDIRMCALEHGVKLWELAMQLGISPETMSRRLRRELTAEEKEVMVQSILAVERENTK